MSSGVYKITEETCKKNSASLKGRKIEWSEKISEANSGENHYNYGKELSDELKKKISNSLKGKKKTKKHKELISKSKKGIKFSDEHRRKLSEAAKNRKKHKK